MVGISDQKAPVLSDFLFTPINEVLSDLLSEK